MSFAAGVVLSVSVSAAHHSIAGVYDGSRQMNLDGVVTQFQFINPHPFVTIEVRNADGVAVLWRLEMDNRSELLQIGMSSETLKQGDRVIVNGSPARDQSQGLYIRRLDRPSDGFRYEQIGSSPRIRAPR
jgi:hypothetical protein